MRNFGGIIPRYKFLTFISTKCIPSWTWVATESLNSRFIDGKKLLVVPCTDLRNLFISRCRLKTERSSFSFCTFPRQNNTHIRNHRQLAPCLIHTRPFCYQLIIAIRILRPPRTHTHTLPNDHKSGQINHRIRSRSMVDRAPIIAPLRWRLFARTGHSRWAQKKVKHAGTRARAQRHRFSCVSWLERRDDHNLILAKHVGRTGTGTRTYALECQNIWLNDTQQAMLYEGSIDTA